MSLQEQVIRQLEDFILAEHNLHREGRIPFEHQGKTEYGYPYIRGTNDLFEVALRTCAPLVPKPTDEVRFLEVGCGLGTKCEIARLHGLKAAGFDLKREYVDLAREIFQDGQFDEGNALEFDYSTYDLVYYHVPFFEDAMLFQLEVRILLQLPIKGVLFVTQLSDALQRVIYDAGEIKSSFQQFLLDPHFDLGRFRVLQKLAEIGPERFAQSAP